MDGTFSVPLPTSWPEVQYPAVHGDLWAAPPGQTRLMVTPSPAVRWERARRCLTSYFRVLPTGKFPSWLLSQRRAFVFNDLSAVSLPSCASVSPATEQEKKRLPYFYKNFVTAIPVPANSFKKDWTEISAYVCKTLNFNVFFQLHGVHLSILFFLELLTLSNSKMYPKQIKVV